MAVASHTMGVSRDHHRNQSRQEEPPARNHLLPRARVYHSTKRRKIMA